MKVNELLNEASAAYTKMRDIMTTAKQELGITGDKLSAYVSKVGKHKGEFPFNKREINSYLKNSTESMGLLLFADISEDVLKRILDATDSEDVSTAVLKHPKSTAELVHHAAANGSRYAKRAALKDKRLTVDDLKIIADYSDTREEAKSHKDFSKIKFTDAEQKKRKQHDSDVNDTKRYLKSVNKNSTWQP